MNAEQSLIDWRRSKVSTIDETKEIDDASISKRYTMSTRDELAAHQTVFAHRSHGRLRVKGPTSHSHWCLDASHIKPKGNRGGTNNDTTAVIGPTGILNNCQAKNGRRFAYSPGSSREIRRSARTM
jgi:hypothetical protein